MGTHEKETILLVHGTFARPDPQLHPQWYEQGSAFCRKLEGALKELESPARCWAHTADVPFGETRGFSWTGENHWRARAEAARLLAAHLDDIIRGGWRCHIVAHSHGGNVVMDALRQMKVPTSPGYADAWHYGSLVTMGTPFMQSDESALPVFYRWPLLFALILVVPAFLYLLAPAGTAGSFSVHAVVSTVASAPWYGLLLFVWFALSLAIFIFFARLFAKKQIGAHDPSHSNQLLVMKSSQDEVWLVLDGLQSGRIRKSVDAQSAEAAVQRLKRWFKETVRLAKEIDRLSFPSQSAAFELFFWGWILLAAVILHAFSLPRGDFFFSLTAWVYAGVVAGVFLGHWRLGLATVLAPVRIVSMILFIVGTAIHTMGFKLAKRGAWGVLQSLATGLAGYPLPGPRITQTPSLVDPGFFKEHEVDAATIAAVVARRGAGIGAGANTLVEALENPELARDQLHSTLRGIARNTALCHAIYYTDDACVAEIAHWIARSDKQIGDW